MQPSLKNSLYVWAGPNTEWLKECDIKLELSGKIYERCDEVGELRQKWYPF